MNTNAVSCERSNDGQAWHHRSLMPLRAEHAQCSWLTPWNSQVTGDFTFFIISSPLSCWSFVGLISIWISSSISIHCIVAKCQTMPTGLNCSWGRRLHWYLVKPSIAPAPCTTSPDRLVVFTPSTTQAAHTVPLVFSIWKGSAMEELHWLVTQQMQTLDRRWCRMYVWIVHVD